MKAKGKVKMAAFCVALGAMIAPKMSVEQIDAVISEFCHRMDMEEK